MNLYSLSSEQKLALCKAYRLLKLLPLEAQGESNYYKFPVEGKVEECIRNAPIFPN